MSTQDFDAAVDAFRAAMQSMPKGNHRPVIDLYSRRADVTLANPLGPPIVGWANIDKEAAAVAARFVDGSIEFDEVTRFVSGDLGYTVTIERGQVRRKGSDKITPLPLRVTMIFRREDGKWFVALRHADTVTKAQA